MWYAQLDASGIFSCCYLWMTFYPELFCFAVVIKCFMIGVNVWCVYLAPQNIPHAISVLTLGNKVVYCILLCSTCVTTLTCKRSLSFCQSAGGRLLLSTVELNIHVALHEVTWHGVWLYGVHNTSSHVTTKQRCNHCLGGCSKCTVKS